VTVIGLVLLVSFPLLCFPPLSPLRHLLLFLLLLLLPLPPL
jgi:hypothetical protein